MSGAQAIVYRTGLLILLALLVMSFSLSAIEVWHPRFAWHDQQRVAQLILLGGAALILLMQGPHMFLPHWAFYTVVCILTLGLVSSLMAEFPLWALKEWARYAGLVMLAVVVGATGRRKWCLLVFGIIGCTGLLQAFQFSVYYAVAFLSGIYLLDIHLLFSGFSNPRFFAQFQTLLIPVLSFLILYFKSRKVIASVAFYIVLSIHFCIALAMGGRGLWMALAVSAVALLVITPRYWRLLAIQASAGLTGGLVFVVFFYWLPEWLDIPSLLGKNFRGGLSGREHLWFLAIDMAKENPWLGVGPMHFSAVVNSVAAHPHQVILQWSAEWGVPVTILASILAGRSMYLWSVQIRGAVADYTSAALWLAILGALLLAQVDGVFVMPYTETWLAILVGLALSMCSPLKLHQRCYFQRATFTLLAVPVLLVTWHVMFVELPTLPDDSDLHMAKHNTGWTPRFWLQGWIPMDGAAVVE